MNKDHLGNSWESTASINVRLNVHLIAELERRRTQWGFQSRGAVLEALLGWMVEKEGPDTKNDRF